MAWRNLRSAVGGNKQLYTPAIGQKKNNKNWRSNVPMFLTVLIKKNWKNEKNHDVYSKASRKPKKAMQDPHKMLKIEKCEFFTKSEKIRKSQVLLEPIQNCVSPGPHT